jgi:hypothetical protein
MDALVWAMSRLFYPQKDDEPRSSPQTTAWSTSHRTESPRQPWLQAHVLLSASKSLAGIVARGVGGTDAAPHRDDDSW